MSSRGFTLVEVVVTIFVLGVFFVLLGSAVNLVSLTREARFKSLALRGAQSELENLRAESYDTLPAQGSFSDPLLSSLPNASSTFSVTAYDAHLKQVSVFVSWQEEGRPSASVSLTTLRGEHGGL